MNVIERFASFIEEKDLVRKEDKLLLAVSGGKDSMLMLRLFYELGYKVELAHCNFRLRDKESDLDEQLVVDYAKELEIPVHVKTFDTKSYSTENGVSIQMAARDLRYHWFEELRKELNCEYIAIAQHLNDHIETALFNLTRSTGLQGLTGIAVKRDRLIRPLLCFTADEVKKAVKLLEVPYRDDQSNFSTKYARNKIRLEIIPKFKEIQGNFESIMVQNMEHFEESQNFIEREISKYRMKLFHQNKGFIQLNLSELEENIEDSYFLYELFKPFGFQKNVLQDFIQVYEKPMGQVFESESHEMLLDREKLIIREKKIKEKDVSLIIDQLDKSYFFNNQELKMNLDEDLIFDQNLNRVQIDFDSLEFPLKIRIWNQGDSFIPLGMNGKKKISDFLIQQKINRFDKENVTLLLNGNEEIIWLIGYRLDNRYKVNENTKKVLTLVIK